MSCKAEAVKCHHKTYRNTYSVSMVTIDIDDIEPNQKALVFGASAEPGASVVEGNVIF